MHGCFNGTALRLVHHARLRDPEQDVIESDVWTSPSPKSHPSGPRVFTPAAERKPISQRRNSNACAANEILGCIWCVHGKLLSRNDMQTRCPRTGLVGAAITRGTKNYGCIGRADQRGCGKRQTSLFSCLLTGSRNFSQCDYSRPNDQVEDVQHIHQASHPLLHL